MIKTDRRELYSAIHSIKVLSTKVPKALRSAVIHTGKRLQTAAIKEVRKEYFIKTGDVKKLGGLRLSFPTSGQIILRSRGQNVPLIKFRTTPTRVVKRKPKTLKAAVKRGDKKPVKGAFVQQMKNGNVGVYRRVGSKRLPIEQLYGPAVPIMFGSKQVRERLQSEMDERLGKRIVHELERVNRELSNT